MTSNPLALRRSEMTSVNSADQLHEHVAKLNNYRWIADSGKLYFDNQRTRADGSIEHFVDRHI